jgi:2,3-dihydroxyphenylpropionate 1,2-dioxygenase
MLAELRRRGERFDPQAADARQREPPATVIPAQAGRRPGSSPILDTGLRRYDEAEVNGVQNLFIGYRDPIRLENTALRGEESVNTTVIGGAMLPHAPQFFTLPETEDRATVARVERAAAEIGERLKALQPELWVVFANDHAEQFFHRAAPPFTVHVGAAATGEFAGRKFHWQIAGDTGLELVRQLYRQGFDPAFTSTAQIDYAIGIPLTHLGLEAAILPIYVNAYLPPQPTIERCWAFGEAVARIVTAMGKKTAVVASGGMSHFPGTERYSEPDLAFDKELLARLETGNLRALLAYDAAALDRTGNVELRCWACAAGTLGERKPDIVQLAPSWHHTYASLGFFGGLPAEETPHYPAIRPELTRLTEALHGLAHDKAQRARYLADAAAYAEAFGLPPEQRVLLLSLDRKALVALGIHPLLAFLAEMQVARDRRL